MAKGRMEADFRYVGTTHVNSDRFIMAARPTAAQGMDQFVQDSCVERMSNVDRNASTLTTRSIALKQMLFVDLDAGVGVFLFQMRL